MSAQQKIDIKDWIDRESNGLVVLGDGGRDAKNRYLITKCVRCGERKKVRLAHFRDNVAKCACSYKPLRRPKKRIDGFRFGGSIVYGDVGSLPHAHRLILFRCGFCGKLKTHPLELVKKHKGCGCQKFANHVNEEHGDWTVLECVGRKHNQQLVRCRCKCGTEKVLLINSLTQKQSTSCRKCAGERNRTDYVGRVYGKWTVIKRLDVRHGQLRVLCRCECGKEAERYIGSLTQGTSLSCRCACRADYTDAEYGWWTVLKSVGRDKTGHQRLLCRCKCGTERVVDSQSLVQEKSQSCGCGHDYQGWSECESFAIGVENLMNQARAL